MQATIRLIYKEYGHCPGGDGWAYGAHLKQFLDLLLDQKLLSGQVSILLVADWDDSRFHVNFMHLT